MKASELKGRAVISLAEAQKVGEIDTILFDLGACRVAGFRVKQGLFGGGQLLSADDVQSVGPDALMIANREVLRDRESNPDLNNAPDLNDLSDIKVVTESGAHVGALGDADVDPQTMMLTTYYLSESLWEHLAHGTKSFTATPSLRFGGKLLIIPDALAAPLMPVAAAPAAPPPAVEEAALLPLAATEPASPAAFTLEEPEPPSSALTGEESPPPPAVADAAPTPYPAARRTPAEEAGSGGGTT